MVEEKQKEISDPRIHYFFGVPTSLEQSATKAEDSFNTSSNDFQQNVSSSQLVTDTRETASSLPTITTAAVKHYLQGTHNLTQCYHLLIRYLEDNYSVKEGM